MQRSGFGSWSATSIRKDDSQDSTQASLAIVFGIALALLTYLSVIPATLGWLAVAGSIFGGAFAIFEARKGWCIVRAVGIKTPL